MYIAHINLPAYFSEDDIKRLSEGFEDLSLAFSALRKDNDDSQVWLLEWVSENLPVYSDFSSRLALLQETCALPHMALDQESWRVETLPEINWLEHSYRQFPPFSVGPFFIYGSHWQGDVPKEQISLQIDAATAFGSGEHGTTKGCLQAMLDLKGKGFCPWNVLDMGTGSGILAIAAWKLWHTPILAVDNDAEAVRVTEHHIKINNIKPSTSSIVCAVGDGFSSDITQKKKPFDLVIANILAGPLIEMAQSLKAVTDENGFVILSGLLQEQAPNVLSVYEALGLKKKKKIDIGEWSTLVLHNPAG